MKTQVIRPLEKGTVVSLPKTNDNVESIEIRQEQQSGYKYNEQVLFFSNKYTVTDIFQYDEHWMIVLDDNDFPIPATHPALSHIS